MKAMIFAAGLGTRLRPLTNDRPKAMVELAGMPLLEIIIRRLRYFGYRDIIINVHHYPKMIVDFLAKKKNFGIDITISDETTQVLETGGGLRKAAWFFDEEPFLVHNVDILTDLNYHELADFHQKNEAIVTLALRQRNSSRYLLFDEAAVLSGWTNVKTGEVKLSRGEEQGKERLAFSGIHMIDPALLSMFSQTGKFSIIDTYLEVAKTKIIAGFNHTTGLWLDVGKPELLAKGDEVLTVIRKELD